MVKIMVITIVRNEEVMMPFFMRHYNQFADKILVIDKQSNDYTAMIVEHYGGEVVSWPCHKGELDDLVNIEIKNTYYQKYAEEYDWFIVVDADELLYYDGDIKTVLEQYNKETITFPHNQGYEMVGDMVPCDDGTTQLWSIIKHGVPSVTYSKQVIFHRSVQPNYGAGAHVAQPTGVVVTTTSPFKLLHYRNLSPSWCAYRARRVKLSKRNVAYRLGTEGANVGVSVGTWYDLDKNKVLVLP